MIDAVADLPSDMAGPTSIPDDLLKDTSFSGKTVRGALMPNWIPFYFGNDLPCGTLKDDGGKDGLTAHGPGYRTWTNLVIHNKRLADDIMTIIDVVTDAGKLDTYIGHACTADCSMPRESLCAPTSNGHFGTVTIPPSR